MNLGLSETDLATCVQCGLCLTHCPTFRITGDEAWSPRGRIRLMREVQHHDLPVSDDVMRAFDTCVQCRACETACPSGVPYGRLIEGTRVTLEARRPLTRRATSLSMKALGHPRLLRIGTSVLAVAQRVGLRSRRFALPARLPMRSRKLVASGDDVYLFTGCVMDAWQRDVHRSTQRVVEAFGFGVTPTGDTAPCCGALCLHAGDHHDAKAFARRVVARLSSDDRPVLVDSAGCGAAMKEYGRLLGTPEAEAFARRVFDVSEWLAHHLDRFPVVDPLPLRVAVQDPCHLRHVQRVHAATRAMLGPVVAELLELDDDGLCCGAGGAYAILEPAVAAEIRARKLEVIASVNANVVASANPGCALHLAAGGAKIVHVMEILDAAIAGTPLVVPAGEL